MVVNLQVERVRGKIEIGVPVGLRHSNFNRGVPIKIVAGQKRFLY